MFATGAFVLVVLIMWSSNRANNSDESSRQDDNATRDMIRFARQDIRLIAYLLAGVILMLGILADRVH